MEACFLANDDFMFGVDTIDITEVEDASCSLLQESFTGLVGKEHYLYDDSPVGECVSGSIATSTEVISGQQTPGYLIEENHDEDGDVFAMVVGDDVSLTLKESEDTLGLARSNSDNTMAKSAETAEAEVPSQISVLSTPLSAIDEYYLDRQTRYTTCRIIPPPSRKYLTVGRWQTSIEKITPLPSPFKQNSPEDKASVVSSDTSSPSQDVDLGSRPNQSESTTTTSVSEGNGHNETKDNETAYLSLPTAKSLARQYRFRMKQLVRQIQRTEASRHVIKQHLEYFEKQQDKPYYNRHPQKRRRLSASSLSLESEKYSIQTSTSADVSERVIQKAPSTPVLVSEDTAIQETSSVMDSSSIAQEELVRTTTLSPIPIATTPDSLETESESIGMKKSKKRPSFDSASTATTAEETTMGSRSDSPSPTLSLNNGAIWSSSAVDGNDEACDTTQATEFDGGNESFFVSRSFFASFSYQESWAVARREIYEAMLVGYYDDEDEQDIGEVIHQDEDEDDAQGIESMTKVDISSKTSLEASTAKAVQAESTFAKDEGPLFPAMPPATMG